MPILLFDQPRCVMIRVPKTGSTTVIKNLFGSAQRAEDRRMGEFPPAWSAYYTFAFVRHPLDRLLSVHRMFRYDKVGVRRRWLLRRFMSLDKVLDVVEDPRIDKAGRGFASKLKRHAMPATDPFFCIDHADDVFRYEAFDTAYPALCGKLGVPADAPTSYRTRRRGAKAGDVDPRVLERVERVFRGDLDRFGYSLEDDGADADADDAPPAGPA